MSRFFDVYNVDDFKIAKEKLSSFKLKYYNEFVSLFLEGADIKYFGNLLDILVDFGLVDKYKDHWRANYPIYCYDDNYFVTDSFNLPEIDRVFPISQDESIYLASQLTVNKKDSVLDIGTGSGIYAIKCAKITDHVVAIDINPKAILYAEFNARLNGVRDRIEFYKMDIRQDSIAAKFNFIVSNPAIIPAPAGSDFYLHSDGGIKGTDMSFNIIKNVNNNLLDGGKLKMLCTSFKGKGRKLALVEFIEEYFCDSTFEFIVSELYNPPLDNIAELLDKYRHIDTFEEFEFVYKNENNLSLHYLLLEVLPGDRFNIKYKNDNVEFNLSEYNGTWNARLNRLFKVYKEINRHQRMKIGAV